MPDFLPRIAQLKKTIEDRLLPLIDNDYVLLDLPLHSNIGDSLIWQGELDFLRGVPFRCLGEGCLKTWSFPALNPGAVILLHGGGNFGDLYPRHQNFRLRVTEHYPDHRIIILPQSVHYDHRKFLEEDMEQLRRHRDLWICVRDRESFDLLRLHLPPERIQLIPDMAFCIDRERLLCTVRNPKRPALLVKRTDKEARCSDFAKHPTNDMGHEIPDMDICDWPGFEHRTFCPWIMARLRCWRKIIGNKTVIRFANTIFRPHRIKSGIRFISRYQHIYTTRLHAAILAILLGREVTVLDNSYGKNSRFFRTWFADSGIQVVEKQTGRDAA